MKKTPARIMKTFAAVFAEFTGSVTSFRSGIETLFAYGNLLN